jgi:dUTP pyrophosphatase
MWKKDFSDNKKSFDSNKSSEGRERRSFGSSDEKTSFGNDRREGGFNRGSREGGFNRGPREGGFNRGPREGGFNRGPREGGFGGGERRSGGSFRGERPRRSFSDNRSDKPSNGGDRKKSKPAVEFLIINNGFLPKYMSENATGCDISYNGETKIIKNGEITSLNTGIKINSLPEKLDIQIRGRSGLSSKGLLILNPNIAHKEEIILHVINLGKEDITIENGHRIGQLVFSFIQIIDINDSEKLSETKRDDQGFGSTGV